jgi:hypothetical protein
MRCVQIIIQLSVANLYVSVRGIILVKPSVNKKGNEFYLFV